MDEQPQQEAVIIALAQAKRVQRESRLLVQMLARLRDGDPLDTLGSTHSPKEAQSTHEQDH